MKLANIPGYLLHPGRIIPKLKTMQNPDRYLRKLSGVIHVGANVGQERALYEKYKLNVIWVEPIPEVFSELKANLESYPRQRAYQYLITDSDDRHYQFGVATNGGSSSSIFELAKHRDIWNDISYERRIDLSSSTLPTFIKQEGIDIRQYDGLILDTQGSELLVLQGAISLLRHFKFIKVEVPDFESYKGCCQLKDVAAFFEANNFREYSRIRIAGHQSVGNYHDVVYRQQSAADMLTAHELKRLDTEIEYKSMTREIYK